MNGKRTLKRIGLPAGILILILVLVGPFLVPIPPLEATATPADLADADSRFVDLGSLTVHYKMVGESEPVFVLLHGFGASLFSWREVMGPLAELGTVIAYDRPAFGLTERPMPGDWTGENPYSPEAQADLVIALLDELGVSQAVLVGNSAGGTIATLTALRYPERVQALVEVDAAIYAGGGAPDWARPLLSTPQIRRLGPLFARTLFTRGDELVSMAWHDPSKVTPEIMAGYRESTQLPDWDRALWELTLASRRLDLPEQLSQIQMPALVISGDDDRIVPTEQSLRLAEELPDAELVVIPQCGHVPQEECPDAFMQAVEAFLSNLSEN